MEPSCFDEQGNVIESEGLIISCCLSIFTRTETKEESDTDHIGNCFAFRRRISSVGKEQGVNYQCDWHGLDMDRHVCARFSGVLGSHPREFLCHGKEDVRNCFSPNGSTTWGNYTVSVSGRKYLQVVDRI